MFFFQVFRSFARQQVLKPKAFEKKKVNFSEILKDKNFLTSIGITHFPIKTSDNLTGSGEFYSEYGELIGVKSVTEALEYTQQLKLDLILIRPSPLALQITDFTKDVIRNIRIAQTQLARRSLKQPVRIIKIRNSISINDLNGKVRKIEELMEKFWKILVQVEIDEKSKTQTDKSRLLTLRVKNSLDLVKSAYQVTIEETAENMCILLEPDANREKILNKIVQDEEIFKNAEALGEYQRIHSTLEMYANSKVPVEEPDYLSDSEEEALMEERTQQLDEELESDRKKRNLEYLKINEIP